MNVFFTVDVEIWCDGWTDIDAKFANAFQQYIYGTTLRGDYALPYKLEVLQEYGLVGVFFVEPLFAARFGLEPLREIVHLIREASQEIQLHLHTEWVDEAATPVLPNSNTKRQFMRDFSLVEQTTLIETGRHLLEQAGGGRANAFRAGSFGLNKDTLQALSLNDVAFDSSYNASRLVPGSGFSPDSVLIEPINISGVSEYPITVFNDGTGKLRHAQLTACSFREMEGLLWQALESERKSFVILSHNFELLNPAKNRPDDTVVKRFRDLCDFLNRNRDCFNVRGFDGLEAEPVLDQPPPLTSPPWKTGLRVVEQFFRRRYQ